ncbi:hypothetical protein ACUSIJ_23320 [Pseudochelatococcus sp. B33]
MAAIAVIQEQMKMGEGFVGDAHVAFKPLNNARDFVFTSIRFRPSLGP